jgi:hypothetical protein
MLEGTESKVVICERAYAEIINETLQNVRTETGGILLGTYTDRTWYVVESLDPGPKAILRSAYFEYDDAYVTHLANKVRLRYRTNLRLLGLWHRHPGSLDRFSSTDDETNRTYARVCGGSAISGLVNIDPSFRMTFYVAAGDPVQYKRLAVEVGDQHMPGELLRVWDSRGLLHSLASLSSQSSTGRMLNRGGLQAAERSPSALDGGRAAKLFETLKLWKRTFTEVADPPAVSDGDIVELSDQCRQSALIDVLDQELAFLDQQHEYSYELSMQDNGLLVALTSAMEAHEFPSRLEFLFVMADGCCCVSCGDQRYEYSPGITEALLNKALEKV